MGLFEPYQVTSAAIREAAERATAGIDRLRELEAGVAADHRVAVSAVEGDILPFLQAAPKRAERTSQAATEKVAFARGGLHMFAIAVDNFNTDSSDPRSVSKLNAAYDTAVADGFGVDRSRYEKAEGGVQTFDRRYFDDLAAAKEALIAELKAEYGRLDKQLDEDAAEVAAMLKGDAPRGEDVRAMYEAGALPSYAALLFPNVNLSGVEFTRLPTDLRGLSGEQLAEYLRTHPGSRAYVEALLRSGDLSDEERAVVETQARIDAKLVRAAIESGDYSQETLDRIADGQRFLELINELTADNEELSDGAHAYTFAWVNAVGATALTRLPKVVRESFDRTGWRGKRAEAENRYLTPLADAILNLSNGKYQDEVLPDNQGTRYRFDLNGDGRIDVDDMPAAVQQVMDLRIGEYQNGYRAGHVNEHDMPDMDWVKNLDEFNGWADLMAASTVDGGRDFSIDLAEDAIQARQDMNAILAKAAGMLAGQYADIDAAEYDQLRDELSDRGASKLLSVVARNEDASADLLVDDARRQQLLGLNWAYGEGAGDVIRAGTDRDPSGGGGTALQAKAALAVMTDVASDPQEYQRRATNESVTDAIVDVGITWVDTFGENVGTETKSSYNQNDTDVLNRGLPLSVTLSSDDQAGFLQFLAGTGDDDAIRFEAASQHYGRQLIAEALKQDDPDLLDDALEWAGRADGQIRQATIEWAADEMEKGSEDKRAVLLAENRALKAGNVVASMSMSIGGTVAGKVYPPASLFISVGNAVAGPMISDLLAEKPIPDFDALVDEEVARQLESDALDSTSQRNYLLAQVAVSNGDVDPSDPDFAPLFDEDGSLKSLEEIVAYQGRGNALDDLEAAAEKPLDAWNHDHSDTRQVGPSEFDRARDNTNPGVRADHDRRNDGAWRNDEVSVRNLYGDNVPSAYGDNPKDPIDEDGPREMYPDQNGQIGADPKDAWPDDRREFDRNDDGKADDPQPRPF